MDNYFLPGTEISVTLTYGATMDIQIAAEVLENTVEAAGLLGRDRELVARCLAALEKLPPIRIGENGTIMEWIEDYRESEPGHRHISHLLGLYPLHQIGPVDPDLFEAAAETILPDEWSRGSVRGLRAHGGITVAASWEKGELDKAGFDSDRAGTTIIRYGGRSFEWDAEPGQRITLNNRLEIIE